mmetsp:Transcript_33699/g.52445  ORF Transcript_33699/g.52445 Transcript_33699/m.52445 type:complete len:114 (+) Transcript_33699:1377-1718(+)
MKSRSSNFVMYWLVFNSTPIVSSMSWTRSSVAKPYGCAVMKSAEVTQSHLNWSRLRIVSCSRNYMLLVGKNLSNLVLAQTAGDHRMTKQLEEPPAVPALHQVVAWSSPRLQNS